MLFMSVCRPNIVVMFDNWSLSAIWKFEILKIKKGYVQDNIKSKQEQKTTSWICYQSSFALM